VQAANPQPNQRLIVGSFPLAAELRKRHPVLASARVRRRIAQDSRFQRREALDHVMILGERHMKFVLEEYSFRYFNTARPHQGLGQRMAASTPRQTWGDASEVVAMPVLGGLHHDYRAAA
jgi:hypothetical protein